MHDFSLFNSESQKLRNLLDRIFSVDFTLLNKDFNSEESIENNFESQKVVFEDIEGNPLKLQHLVNLNESLRNDPERNVSISYNSIFNLKYIRPWSASQYKTLYMHKFVFQKGYKKVFENSVCFIDGKFRLWGFAKSDFPNHLRILQVERNSKVTIKTSNKVKISEIISDPRYKDKHHSVEATYIFSYGEFTVKWRNCFNVFDWPDMLADCQLKIKIEPDCKDSSLYQLLEEIEQLKIINDAVENDLSTWSLFDNSNGSGLRVDQFKTELNDLIRNGDNIPIDICNKMKIWNRNVYEREKDITETLWMIFKKIDNKIAFKGCINSMMAILSENSSKVQFNANNNTEFCRMLKERFMNSEVMITSFMTNLELIVQLGLFKLTKDLLFIISNELPDLSHDDAMEIFNKCCRVAHLKIGLESLTQLFNCISYMEILKDVLNPPDFKTEASNTVKKLIKCLNNGSKFELEQFLNIKMQGINSKLKSLSSIWIVNFITSEPIRSHKAVVFEVENSKSEFQVYRHDLELSDIQMF